MSAGMQFGHDGRHHGCGTPECPTELHHHHDERCVSPLEERRQRAREAFDDRWSGANDMFGSATWAERLQQAREEAIETATRVQITDEAIREFGIAWHGAPQDGPPGTRRAAALAAALRELGFEVEQ